MALQYQQLGQFWDLDGHSSGVTAVAFSPDGTFLASGGLDGRICVWTVPSGKLHYVFSGKSAVLSLLWVEPCKHLVCGMEDGSLTSLRISRVSLEIHGFWAHKFPVERLVVHGTQLASAAHKEVKVWRYTSDGFKELLADLPAPGRDRHAGADNVIATSLHWTSTPSYPLVLLVTYMHDGIVAFDGQTWNRISGTSLPCCISDASLSKDGRLLAVSSMVSGFSLFSMKGLVEIEPVLSFHQDVGAALPLPVRFLHDDHAIIGGTSHGEVGLWDLRLCSKQTMRLEHHVVALAIAEYHDECSDEFFVAIGIFNRDAPSPIVLWKANDSRIPASFRKGVEKGSDMVSARARCVIRLWYLITVMVFLLICRSSLRLVSMHLPSTFEGLP